MKIYSRLLILMTLSLFSCDDITEIEDISNRTVNILAPSNDVVLNITEVNFLWNSVEDAENYRLQIATPSFENAAQIVADTLITTSNFTKTLAIGNYEWRVRGENFGYQTSYSTQSFSIE